MRLFSQKQRGARAGHKHGRQPNVTYNIVKCWTTLVEKCMGSVNETTNYLDGGLGTNVRMTFRHGSCTIPSPYSTSFASLTTIDTLFSRQESRT